MRTRLFAAALLASLSSAVLAQVQPAAPAAAQPVCDRACLEGFVDQYLEAMLANDASSGLFAQGTKFTENGIRLPLGNEGLWFGMSGIGTYKFYVPDIETGQVAFIGTVKENMQGRGANTGEGNLVALAVRLKIVNGSITEVEQLVMRPEVNLFGGGEGSGGGGATPRFPPVGEAVEAMHEPHAIYREVIPEAERASREELIEAANHYFTGLARNDGKGYYPFTDDCERFENGIQTTQTNCKAQFENGLQGVVSRIRDRRFVAVDRERGIVFSFAFFDHEQINWTWQLAELFKIENGMIRRIEAVFHQAPYGIPSGWSTFEQAMSESIQSVR
jgi:hypothetical protein